MKSLMIFAVCLCLALLSTVGNSYAAAKTDVVIVNNAALKAGQSLNIKAYKITHGKARLIKNLAVGPVLADCANGCGLGSNAIGSGLGDYRLDIISDIAPSEITSIAFTLNAGEEFIWMVSNRAATPSYSKTVPSLKVISNQGPFRIDLVTYTKIDVPAHSAPSKKAKRPFWPFKPNEKNHVVND